MGDMWWSPEAVKTGGMDDAPHASGTQPELGPCPHHPEPWADPLPSEGSAGKNEHEPPLIRVKKSHCPSGVVQVDADPPGHPTEG